MQIASLFARIGLQTDEAKLKSFTSNLKTARQTLVGIGVAVAAASAAIGKVTSDALNAAAAFKQFEAETGTSAQELQRWQAVAEQTNSSAEAVSSAIRAITQNQQAIRLGEGDISGFQLLGIDPRQDPFQILTELRTRTEGLSEAMQRNVLGRLGVGAELLQTIQLSQEEFDRLAGRAFIISPQAIETLAQTRGAMAQAARGIEFLKAQITVGLAPQLKDLSENLILFIQRNQQTFIRGFQRAFAVINQFGRAINTVSRAIDSAIRATFGWESALKVLGAAFVLLNFQALTGPLGLLTAGFIAMLLVIEDIAVYARGGESAIGRLFETFPALERVLSPILNDLPGFADVLNDIFNASARVNDAAENWGKWATAIERAVDALRLLRTEMTERVEFWSDLIGDIRGGEDLDIGGRLLERGVGINRGAAEALLNQSAANNNTTINNNIRVEGVSDPDSTAAAIQRRLDAYFSGVEAQTGFSQE